MARHRQEDAPISPLLVDSEQRRTAIGETHQGIVPEPSISSRQEAIDFEIGAIVRRIDKALDAVGGVPARTSTEAAQLERLLAELARANRRSGGVR
jgi:hypothetical protein